MRISTLDKSTVKNVLPELISFVWNSNLVNWEEENFLRELPMKWQASFAVYDVGEIVAFCIASIKTDSSYYIHLLFVEGYSRNKGVGKKLIDECIRRAKTFGLSVIALRCPLKNKRAHSFYLRQGFSEDSVISDSTSGPDGDYLMLLYINKLPYRNAP